MEIGEVEIGEDSFGGKLSYKRIGERGLVARTCIKKAMCSKDTVREESIGDEKGEKDVTMGEERIEGIEGTESDTGIMSDLGEGDGEIEMITESTKIGEERGVKIGSGEEERDWRRGEERIEVIEGIESDTVIMSEHGEGDGEIEMITKSIKIGEERGEKT